MPSIIVPGRRLIQPQGRLELSPEFGQVGAALLLTAGSVYDPSSNQLFTGTGSTVVGTNGLARRFNGSQFIDLGATSVGGVNLFASADNPFSVVAKFRTSSAGGTGTIVARAGGGSTRTFQMLLNGSGSDPSINIRGAITGTTGGWDFDDAKWHTLTAAFNGSTAAAYGDATRSASVTVGTAAEEASERIIIGARTNGTGFFLTGDIEFVYLLRGALTQNQHLALHESPYQLFRASPRRLYFDVPAAGGVSLVIADATHGHTADNLTLSTSTALAIDDALHAHAADNVTLTTSGAVTLVVQDATHAHTADNLTLTVSLGGITLVIQDATHAQIADALALTTDSFLAVADAFHGHQADNVGTGIFVRAQTIIRYVYRPYENVTDRRYVDQLNQDLRTIYGQISGLSKGVVAAHDARDAAPTGGTWQQGDFVRNFSPTEAGTTPNKYVIIGWVCVASGTPGTWLECRCLTGN